MSVRNSGTLIGRHIGEILQAQATAAKVQGSGPLRELVMVAAVVILITAEMGIMRMLSDDWTSPNLSRRKYGD